jgi:hypothetical protein
MDMTCLDILNFSINIFLEQRTDWIVQVLDLSDQTEYPEMTMNLTHTEKE